MNGDPLVLPDDSWLTLNPEQLDDMLKMHAGSADVSPAADFSLDQMAEGMKAFVGKVSSVEGAEFPSP